MVPYQVDQIGKPAWVPEAEGSTEQVRDQVDKRVVPGKPQRPDHTSTAGSKVPSPYHQISGVSLPLAISSVGEARAEYIREG